MSDEPFVDFYEMLQLSPNADDDTIHRVFRHLAKKHHPDVAVCADGEKFRRLVRAHEVLTNAESRAAYDATYHEYWNRKWKIASEASHETSFVDDADTRHRLLSLMYVQRRRDMGSPGLGEYEMARLLQSPVEMIEFHLWYLREKGFVARTESGYLAITAGGVDEIERTSLNLAANRMLGTRSSFVPGGNGGESSQVPERIEDGGRYWDSVAKVEE